MQVPIRSGLLLLLLPLILSETQHNTSLSSKHVNLVHCASFEQIFLLQKKKRG